MSSQPLPVGEPRADLLRQKTLRMGWVLVGVGLVLPILALAGAVSGWQVRRRDGGGQLALIITGIAVFAIRLTMWMTDTWP